MAVQEVRGRQSVDLSGSLQTNPSSIMRSQKQVVSSAMSLVQPLHHQLSEQYRQLSSLTSSISQGFSVMVHGLPGLLLSELSISPQQRRVWAKRLEQHLAGLETSFHQASFLSPAAASPSRSAARKASSLTVPTSKCQTPQKILLQQSSSARKDMCQSK